MLLFLKEKPRTIDEINDELDTDSVSILPHIKKLKDFELVTHEDKLYGLSPLGKIIIRKMEPLIGAIRQLEESYGDSRQGIKPRGDPPCFFK